MNEFINLGYLGSLTGCVAVVILLTQFFKEIIDKYVKIPTKYVTFLFSLVTMLAYQLGTNTFTFKGIYILLLNAIIVTLTATGGYEYTVKPITEKKQESPVKQINPTKITNDIK